MPRASKARHQMHTDATNTEGVHSVPVIKHTFREGQVISINNTRFNMASAALLSAGFIASRAQLVELNDTELVSFDNCYARSTDASNGDLVGRRRTAAASLTHTRLWNFDGRALKTYTECDRDKLSDYKFPRCQPISTQRSKQRNSKRFPVKGPWSYIFEDDVWFNFDAREVQFALDVAESAVADWENPPPLIYLQVVSKRKAHRGAHVASVRIPGTDKNVTVNRCPVSHLLGGTHAYGVHQALGTTLWDLIEGSTHKKSLVDGGRIRYNIDDRIKYFFEGGWMCPQRRRWRQDNWPICVGINDEKDLAIQRTVLVGTALHWESDAGHAKGHWFQW